MVDSRGFATARGFLQPDMLTVWRTDFHRHQKRGNQNSVAHMHRRQKCQALALSSGGKVETFQQRMERLYMNRLDTLANARY